MSSSILELVKTAARTLLAHRDVGRSCDPTSVKWAETVLRQNPNAGANIDFDDTLPGEVPAFALTKRSKP